MRLALFLIIIVPASLIFLSDACLVFSSDQSFTNESKSNLVAATSEGAEEALIILSTEDGTSMRDSIDYICANGGRVTHIYPAHILIGNVPRAISQQLVGQKGIEGIYYSIVDSSQVKKYGDVAVFAVEAWNNNFMGQANLKGLTPDPEAPEPAPIKADVKISPSRNESKDLQIANAPYGAGYYDTSEYMIGKISVAIILPESNGAIDRNQENWASSDISNVVSKVQAGLNWWAAREWKANLQFTYNLYVVATGYEPISRPSTDDNLWIGEVMSNIGYTSGYYVDRVRAYLNDRRNWDGTDWAFAIFVAHSWWDLDGMFADRKYFAYTYTYGGPFMVMTYDNDNYGIANMDAVTAHETGHIFYALDEYYDAKVPPTSRSGYLNVENQNTEYGGSSNVPCIMRGGTPPYTQGAVCYYTRGQIGWRDTDGDGILDIIDFEPDTVLTSYSPDPTQDNTPTYSGTAYTTATYPNMNPYSSGNYITINIITRVQYRVDGGAWIDATPSDGAFNQVVENFIFTTSPLATGTYTFQVRALNRAGNWETSYASDVLTIDVTPPNAPSVSESHCGSGWTTHNSPYFTWSNPGDTGTGVWYYEGSLNDGAPFTVSSPYHPTWTEGTYTFKVRAVDRVGLQGGWSNVVTIRIDTTPPSGSISINAGATYATLTSVTLTLSANDAGSGVAQMSFSNDGYSWTSWQTYVATASWTLASGDGVKTVYVLFKDNAGIVSSPYSDTIILDTTPPTGSIIIAAGATYTTSIGVTLTLSASDANGVAQMHFSNDGSVWSSWEPYATSRSRTLTTGDETKTVYVQFKDNAELISTPYSDSIVLDTVLPSTPVLLSPPDGGTVSRPTFEWSPASDATSGVASYTLQIDSSQQFDSTNLRTISGITTTSYRVILRDGTWYWRVMAIDNAGNTGSFSAHWSVNVENAQFTLFHPHTEFWFTWYDNVDTEICNIHFVNTGTSTATITVYITGSPVDSFTLGAGLSTYRNYAVNNGPVHVVGTQALWVTKRVVGWGGFKEVYGFPSDAASTDIYYTWYDYASPGVSTDRIYLTNPSASSTATAQIYIGGIFMKTVTLSAGESKYEVFLGVINGPVRITSDIPIFSTQLVIGWGDFDEIVGTPSWYVSNEHYFTWYDLAGASIDNIHIINLGASTAQINIWIAGVLRTATPISLPSGGQTYVNYPGVIGGPVRIVSDQPIRVTQRIVGWGGFKEVFSVPSELLASSYYFTWYDWASPPVNWDALHFMNPSATQTAHITVRIGGNVMTTLTLAPGQANYATFQGTINGPILITSDIPIMATQRILGWSSFEETIGIQWTID